MPADDQLLRPRLQRGNGIGRFLALAGNMTDQTVTGFTTESRRALSLQMLNTEGVAPETRHIVRIHKLGEHHRRFCRSEVGAEGLHTGNKITCCCHPAKHLYPQNQAAYR